MHMKIYTNKRNYVVVPSTTFKQFTLNSAKMSQLVITYYNLFYSNVSYNSLARKWDREMQQSDAEMTHHQANTRPTTTVKTTNSHLPSPVITRQS